MSAGHDTIGKERKQKHFQQLTINVGPLKWKCKQPLPSGADNVRDRDMGYTRRHLENQP